MRLEQYNALRKTVETRFGTFEYAEAGDGPAALFIHGLFVSPYFWKDVIERLADQRHCIAYSLPGHGHSEVSADQDLSLAAGVEDLSRRVRPSPLPHRADRGGDRLIPFAAGRELARRIPDAELVVHEGAGHAILLERPDECRERSEAFYDTTEAHPQGVDDLYRDQPDRRAPRNGLRLGVWQVKDK